MSLNHALVLDTLPEEGLGPAREHTFVCVLQCASAKFVEEGQRTRLPV